jgi:hypothetical protein
MEQIGVARLVVMDPANETPVAFHRIQRQPLQQVKVRVPRPKVVIRQPYA